MAKYKFEQIAINSTEKKKPVEQDRFAYIGLEHMDPGCLNVTRFGTEVAPVGEKLIMHKGDVLFGKRRAYQKKVAIAPFDGIFSAHGMVLRPREDIIDRRFFPLFISSDYFLDAAIKISVGSLSPTINWRDLKELEFELPDLDRQRKLAEVLWAINDAVESYKKLLDVTDKLVKARFEEMFGGNALVDLNYPVIQMDEVFNISSSKRILKSEWRDSGIPFLRVRDMVRLAMNQPADNDFFVSDELYASLCESDGIPQAGDIMVSATSTIGKCYEVKPGERFYYKDADILRFRKKIDINSTFFMYCMKLPVLMNQIEATLGVTTVSHFLIARAKTLKVPMPPMEQQQKFAAFVHQTDKSKSELEQALSELTATYKRILSENLG